MRERPLHLGGEKHALWLIHGGPNVYQVAEGLGHEGAKFHELLHILLFLKMPHFPEPLGEGEVEQGHDRGYVFAFHVSEHVQVGLDGSLVVVPRLWLYPAPFDRNALGVHP